MSSDKVEMLLRFGTLAATTSIGVDFSRVEELLPQTMTRLPVLCVNGRLQRPDQRLPAGLDSKRDRADLFFEQKSSRATRDNSLLQQYKRSANRGVFGKGQLPDRRKYAQASRAVLSCCGKHERGFRQVELA